MEFIEIAAENMGAHTKLKGDPDIFIGGPVPDDVVFCRSQPPSITLKPAGMVRGCLPFIRK